MKFKLVYIFYKKSIEGYFGWNLKNVVKGVKLHKFDINAKAYLSILIFLS
jgi:hypothetical protein